MASYLSKSYLKKRLSKYAIRTFLTEIFSYSKKNESYFLQYPILFFIKILFFSPKLLTFRFFLSAFCFIFQYLSIFFKKYVLYLFSSTTI